MNHFKFKHAEVKLYPRSSIVQIRNGTMRTIERINELKKDFSGVQMTPNAREEIKELRASLKNKDSTCYQAKILLKKYKYTVTVQTYFIENHLLKFGPRIEELIFDAIRTYRKQHTKAKPLKIEIGTMRFETWGFESGRVFAKPGQVYEKYILKKVKDLYTDKRPESQVKYVGLELEFCAPISETDFALKLYAAGLQKFVQLKHDGSLRPQAGETGYELAILLREANYRKELKKIFELLGEVKAVVENRRCGLHVHLDMRKRNKEVVYSNLVSCQDALLKVVDPRRTDNEFCRTVESRKFPTKFKGDRQERYRTINAAAYYKYKTLEVRMHQGSLDYSEVINWIGLLLKITNHRIKIKNNIYELPILRKRFKLKKKVYNNLIDKSCYWQVNRIQQEPPGIEFTNGVDLTIQPPAPRFR